jgi:hypothetical protein
MELTVTIDDPKTYTKPFDWLKAKYYWMVKQDFEETFCVPAGGLSQLTRQAGWQWRRRKIIPSTNADESLRDWFVHPSDAGNDCSHHKKNEQDYSA